MKSVFKNHYITALFLLFSATSFAQNAKYKCMLQMTNYKGLEAYVVVSLIDPQGNYEKTLYMMGPDKQWYNGFKEWDKAQKKMPLQVHQLQQVIVALLLLQQMNLK